MTDPAELLHANRTRRRVRRVLLLASLPLVVVALALCGKLLGMYAFAHQAASAYAQQDYAGTVQAARGQLPLNWFEPYKAPFNLGVGLADGGDLAGARAAFEESLALAGGLEQCVVRVNLAIVLERIGDAALRDGDPRGAASAWQEALVVMQDAPPACDSEQASASSSDPERDLGETLDEQEQRVREKLEDSRGDEPDEAPQQEQPDRSELDEIKEQLEQGAEDRRDRDSRGDGAGTDRPW